MITLQLGQLVYTLNFYETGAVENTIYTPVALVSTSGMVSNNTEGRQKIDLIQTSHYSPGVPVGNMALRTTASDQRSIINSESDMFFSIF